MIWIYLSPHLDDAVLSCGGMIWEQVQAGETVEVWTIFTGDPQPPLSAYAEGLHRRWQAGLNASHLRRLEDKAACEQIGASARHFGLPDCIYRRSPITGQPVVQSDADLFQPIHPDESYLPGDIASMLADHLPDRCELAAPLTLGGHMDHRLVRAAAEVLILRLHYYPDFPYADKLGKLAFTSRKNQQNHYPVSTDGLTAWQNAVACYQSQISSFWQDETQMRESLSAYHQKGGGQFLFQDTVENL